MFSFYMVFLGSDKTKKKKDKKEYDKIIKKNFFFIFLILFSKE